MENPFSHTGIVTGTAFCNRKREIADLIYHAKHSQNVLLYSHRRAGKTSLVHQLMATLKNERPRIRPVYIDLYGTIDERDFIESVFTGLTQIESKIDKLLKLASGLRLGSSIDPTTGQPSVSVSINPTDRPRYLDNAMRALDGYSAKQKLLVVFDEFQEIAKYTEKGFEKRLRSHIQSHGHISYIFAGSQKHILAQMFNSGDRAFYKMATSYPLNPIAMKDYVNWAQGIFRTRGVDLGKEIITDIIERCDLQPMYIQQFLFELWRLNEFSPGVLDRLELEILKRRENELMILWDSLTPNQRKALRLLSETEGEGIYYADALQKSGFKAGAALKRALESLSSREIITKNRTYHIQDAMLKKWVQRNFTT